MEFKNKNESQTILVTNLPPTISEGDIAKQVKGIQTKGINIFHEKASGISKSFALVEFYRTKDAEYWMQKTQGKLNCNGKCLQLQYTARENKPTPAINKISDTNNWKCIHCGTLYFTWGEICLTCKQPSNLNTKYREKTSRKLMLQNVNVLTKPYHVLKFIKTLSPRVADKIKNVVVERDVSTSSTRYVCYLSFNTKQDAVETHDFLKHKSPLIIRKTTVTLSYCPDNFSNKKIPSVYRRNFAPRLVPETCNYNLDKSDAHNTYGHVTIPTGTDGLIYSPPDYNSFVYDINSQYFYDVKTGLYFDANTQNFYNTEIRQNLYFDVIENTYKLVNIQTSCDNIDPASSDKTTKKINPKSNEKSKIKKSKDTNTPQEIAKQMERWAKKVNRKKPSPREKNVTEVKPSPKQKDKDANDICFNVIGRAKCTSSPLELNKKQILSNTLPTNNIFSTTRRGEIKSFGNTWNSSQISSNGNKWDINSQQKNSRSRINENLEVARYLEPVTSDGKTYYVKDGGLADGSDLQQRLRQEYRQQRIFKEANKYNYRQYVKEMTQIRFKKTELLSSFAEELKND